MSLKNEIEKTMYAEGLEDRIQDIASLIDAPVEGVKRRMKTLSFSDYIFVMNAVDNKDKLSIERLLGLVHSPIEDTEDEEEQHRRDVKHGLYGDDEEDDESEDDKEQHRRDVKHGLYGDVDESKILEDRTDVADRLADLANSQITDYFASEDELHDFMYSELTSDEDYHDGGKTIDWAMGRVNGDVKAWIDEGAEMHISPDIARAKTLQHTLPSLDREKYEPRDGLEGPIMTKSGKVVYYDPIEGSYYDPDTDIYLSYEEWKDLSEAYSMGSQGPDDEEEEYVDEPVGAIDSMDQATAGKVKTARIQAMQRLGRDNLGGATAAQAADAMDKAEQGKPLTPIQRQAMAYQAQNLDSLAGSPDTRIQFRNLLNRLRKQQQQQEQ